MPLTGIDMAINGEHTARLWRIEDRTALRRYRASNGKGGTGRTASIKDFVGIALLYGVEPTVLPGDDFTFNGSVDGTNGSTGAAYVEALEVVVNQEENAYIESVLEFSRQGAITHGSAAATDVVIPDPPTSCGATIAIDTVDLLNIVNQKLRITCKGKAYVSSSTACGRVRKRGHHDAEVTFRILYDTPAGFALAKDTDFTVDFKCGTAGTYALKYMRLEKTVEVIDHESDEVIGADVTLKMNLSNGTLIGSITTPSARVLWPVPAA